MKRLLGLVSILWLSACTTVTQPIPQDLGFYCQGRFSVVVNDELKAHGKESIQGGFVWKEQGQMITITFQDPLGNTVAKLVVQPAQTVLHLNNGTVLQASNPDELLQQQVHLPIPVGRLRYWLKGVRMNGQAIPAEFESDGWTVRTNGSLPVRKLFLSRREQSQTIKVRLVNDAISR